MGDNIGRKTNCQKLKIDKFSFYARKVAFMYVKAKLSDQMIYQDHKQCMYKVFDTLSMSL